MFRKSILFALFVVLALTLAACVEPTTIVETVIITEIVEGEVVEVVVTPTPEPEGPRTLVICLGQEPDTLYPYGGTMLAASQVQEAIWDGPIDTRTYAYQPIILTKLPSIADGDAVVNVIDVVAGDMMVADAGDPVALTPHTTAMVTEGDTAILANGSYGVLHAADSPVLDDTGAPVLDEAGNELVYVAALNEDGTPVLDEEGNPPLYAATVYRPVGCTAPECAVEYTGGDVEVDVLGTIYRPTGCRSQDCATEYMGGTVQMDQMAVTFQFLPGLTFSDGTPLTAANSVYAFNLNADPDTPIGKYVPERTASYEATDDVTVVWTGLPGYSDATYYTNFWSPFPEHLWGQYSAADLVTEVDGQGLWLGWGSYIVDEWVRGDHISLHANPNYFRAAEGLPKFENLVYRIMGENSNANIAAILAGECDIVDSTSGLEDQSELLLELQAAGQINASFVTGTTYEHADFNMAPIEGYAGFAGWDEDGDGNTTWDDLRLRQAVAMCMDRQAVVDTVFYGQSITIDTYIPPEHPLYNPENAHWPYDPVAAGALLDEIGWLDADGDPATPRVATGVVGVPDGTPLQFFLETTTATMRQQATQIMAESALACGMQMDLGYYPASEWFADGPEGKLFGRAYDLGLFAWLTGVEPSCSLFKTDNIPGDPAALNEDGTAKYPSGWGGQNNTGYSNPEFDTVCNAAIQSLPGEEAYTTNHLIAQQIFSEELPMVPLFLRLKLAASRPDICGFFVDPTQNSEMWNIEEFDYGAGCGE